MGPRRTWLKLSATERQTRRRLFCRTAAARDRAGLKPTGETSVADPTNREGARAEGRRPDTRLTPPDRIASGHSPPTTSGDHPLHSPPHPVPRSPRPVQSQPTRCPSSFAPSRSVYSAANVAVGTSSPACGPVYLTARVTTPSLASETVRASLDAPPNTRSRRGNQAPSLSVIWERSLQPSPSPSVFGFHGKRCTQKQFQRGPE